MDIKIKNILAIGGSDPTGGAGIQADIRAGAALGVHVSTAVTAVTVQNSRGLVSINPVSPELLSAQIKAAVEEAFPDAVKVGMLGSPENALVVSDFLQDCGENMPVVVDPLLKVSAGNSEAAAMPLSQLMEIYQNNIFPFATVVTPNLTEAKEFLAANGFKPPVSDKEMAADLLRLWQCNSLILKGGHSEGDIVADYFADNLREALIVSEITFPKIECCNLHGSGCVYSSLLAAHLALGFPMSEAFRKTSATMHEIIEKSVGYQLGESDYGPLNINNYRL